MYDGEADEMSYRGQENGTDGKPRNVEDSAERGDPVPAPTLKPKTLL